jgi:hypothetical protein
VVEYVDYVSRTTSLHGNSKPGAVPSTLPKGVPLLGPRFCPPSYLHEAKRSSTPKVLPETAYLKSITVIHPFFFPGLNNCPQCASTDVLWDGWNATGAREVHGLRREERAVGYQLRCKTCKVKFGKGGSEQGAAQYCFATTNQIFWQRWEHWKIPSKFSSRICWHN